MSKNAPARFEAAKKLTGSMGEYDIVAVTESPSDEVASAVATARDQ